MFDWPSFFQSYSLFILVLQKLQRELEKKAKTHRKKEKKEKKEKGEKRKWHKVDELSTCAVIWGVDAIARGPQVVESNQLEKSDITEEHELPTLSDNICYLSDGIQSGTKRKSEFVCLIRWWCLPDPYLVSPNPYFQF